jgi:single-strand DNA-binding protein
MASVNTVILAGNLVRDPTTRQAGSASVVSFGLAINRKYKTQAGEQREEVTFVDCEAWGRTGELVAQYLTKGRGALVQGRLQLDSWEDKDGNKRSKLKVVADQVQFLDAKGSGDGQAGQGSGQAARQEQPASAGGGGAYPADEPPFL